MQNSLTQEMLKRGYLATNLIFVSTKHTNREIEKYAHNLRQVFKTINKAVENDNIEELLQGDVCTQALSV